MHKVLQKGVLLRTGSGVELCCHQSDVETSSLTLKSIALLCFKKPLFNRSTYFVKVRHYLFFFNTFQWTNGAKNVNAGSVKPWQYLWSALQRCLIELCIPKLKMILSVSFIILSLICSAERARKSLHTNQHCHNHVNISTHTEPAVDADQIEAYCSSPGVCPALWQAAYDCHFDWRLFSLRGCRIWIDLLYG